MKHLWLKLILFLMACDKSEPLDDACYLITDPGVCLAAIPRYYYDQDSGNCKEFLWVDAVEWFHLRLWKNVKVAAINNKMNRL